VEGFLARTALLQVEEELSDEAMEKQSVSQLQSQLKILQEEVDAAQQVCTVNLCLHPWASCPMWPLPASAGW
jgi:hypothetical protein